jgi:hypothetical protein
MGTWQDRYLFELSQWIHCFFLSFWFVFGFGVLPPPPQTKMGDQTAHLSCNFSGRFRRAEAFRAW